MHRGSLSRTVVAFFDMASDSKCEKSFFGSKIAARVTLLNQKVIKKRPSNHILASKISQAHHPNTFWMLLLAQSWSRGVSAPSLGAPERPPGPPKTYVFLKETIDFQFSDGGRNWRPAGNSLELQCALSPRPPIPSKDRTFPIPYPPVSPTRRPALRGRRIDWPAATAADPEKKRWTPIAPSSLRSSTWG